MEQGLNCLFKFIYLLILVLNGAIANAKIVVIIISLLLAFDARF